MYFALVDIVYQNMEEHRYASSDDLHNALKLAAGIRTRIELPNGEVGFIPGSIAFHAMDETAFDIFYNRICDLVALHFLPGVSSENLRAEVENLIGVTHDRRTAKR